MAKNAVQLDVGSFRFDPTREGPDIPRTLVFTDEPTEAAYYIVQLKQSPTREHRTRLERTFRLDLTEYVAKFGYIERLDPTSIAKLRDYQLVRAVTRYEPAFKISPAIGAHEFRTEERRAVAGVLVWIVLFPAAEPRQIAERVARLGAEILNVSDDRKLGGAVRIRALLADQEPIARIAHIEEVRWIEEITEIIDDNVNAATTNQSGIAGTSPVWNQGLHGENQIVGIIDAGLPEIDHCFFEDPVDNAPTFAHRKIVANRNGTGSHWHSTFAAGCLAGDDFNNPGAGGQRGSAWAARLVCGRNGEVFSGSALSEFAEAASLGAFIHSNSWHEDNPDASNRAKYSQIAVDTDGFLWNNEDHLVLGSAGNTGEEQGAPGTAKNAICVSAAMADPNENILGDGNPGPTADGRQKPDLVGVGCGIQSADDGTACGVTALGCATSWATPHVAGAAALARQYYTEGWYPTGSQQPSNGFVPTGSLLKATLLNSTRNMTGVGGSYPNNTEGWGIIRLDDVLVFAGGALNTRVWDTRRVDGIATGETVEHHIDVASDAQRLKVTLVWADPPSAADTTTDPLVNTLNLEVTSPDGTQTFLGNDFAGGVSTTGGTAEDDENVQMVLINNPAVGDWTIAVVGTEVNVGAPGQGYALVASADLADAPPTVGDQDTLVVRVQFADVAFEPSLPNLQNLMSGVASYIDEVSYGQATVQPAYRGSIVLDQPKSYYYSPERSLLVELVEEVVAKLVAAEPDVFDGDASDPSDDIDRMIIVTNDSGFTGDWATTGTWPYNMPGGFTRPISVSIQSYTNSEARFTHGLLHQFGLVDLYAHPGVVFPRPYVDEWDNMADLFQNVHPLIWSRERAGWVSGHGSTIQYIPRPAAGASYGGLNPIPLFLAESTNTNRKAIAVGLTQGAAAIGAESAFYYVEARSNNEGGFDDSLPDNGVLVYYVNEMIPQGQGPVIIRDDDLTTVSLSDAPLVVGDSLTIAGTGITVDVLAGTGGAAYNVEIGYTPPPTNYNVRITRGDTINGTFYSYFSPDVWVDSPRGGFDQAGGPKPHSDRDQPVIGEVNRVYARISNDGPATAFDFDVRFRISEPYHTVGGEADFDKFIGIAHVDSLASGASTNVKVDWTPVNDGESHACLLVDIINLVGTDTNPNDHEAQENLNKVTSVTGSPYKPVAHNYTLTNPYEQPALFYFRADEVPEQWKVNLSPSKILLNPGERITGSAVITPPPDGEMCSSEFIKISSWTPRGDTMIPLGGAVVQVDLRRPTTLEFDAGTVECDKRDLGQLFEELRKRKQNPEKAKAVFRRLVLERIPKAKADDIAVAFGMLMQDREQLTVAAIVRDWENLFAKPTTREDDRERPETNPEELVRDCRRILARGCTDPPRANEEIIVRFTRPDGQVEYQSVTTDENGCFEAFIVTLDEGIWTVEADYPGNKCDGPASSGPTPVVNKPCDCRHREKEG